MAKKKTTCCPGNIKEHIVPQAAFYATLYYIQYLLQVQANLWVSSLILLVLINVAIFTCPLMKACCK